MRFKIAVKFFSFLAISLPSIGICGNKIVTELEGDHTYSFSKIKFASTASNNYNLNNIEPINISRGQYIAGGVLGTIPGFGIGHAIQGRYTEKGWIFTLSQLASLLASSYFSAQGNPLGVSLSYISFGIFRLWGLIDVWWLPSSYQITSHQNKENNLYITPLVISHNKFSKEALGGLFFNYKIQF